MKILIACEESQAVCMAFRKLGHEAFSCDLQECSGGHPEWHIMGDVLPLINGNCEFDTVDGIHHVIDGKWDMLIAHPPCTYLSNAGAARLYKKIDGKSYVELDRFSKGLKAKEFFHAFLLADCPHIAVENPIPSAVYMLPKYSQIIQPYQFGHPYSKKNLLMAQRTAEFETNEHCRPYLFVGFWRKQKIRWQSPHKQRYEIQGQQNKIQNIPWHSSGNG